MQRISPAVRYFCMDRTYTVLLARALRDGKLGLKTAIELRRRQFLLSARRNKIRKPEVDAHFTPR